MAGKKIRYSKLVALSNSRYEIVSDEPDIRKWRVRNAAGKYLGIVNDLLIDPQANKVRYIVLDLQGKPLNLLSRKILIPIGIAELDDIEDVVILPGITIEQLATLPAYGKGKLSIETERKTGYIFTRTAAQMKKLMRKMKFCMMRSILMTTTCVTEKEKNFLPVMEKMKIFMIKQLQQKMIWSRLVKEQLKSLNIRKYL
jgi:sporulation protein YlmC with PRC-barrel domain